MGHCCDSDTLQVARRTTRDLPLLAPAVLLSARSSNPPPGPNPPPPLPLVPQTSWGNAGFDLTAPPDLQSTDVAVEQIFSTRTAFAALKADGTVVFWGQSNAGGSAPADAGLNSMENVRSIASTQHAFAALKKDGSVESRGLAGNGGPEALNAHTGQPSGLTNIVAVYGNANCFLAVNGDGVGQVWGRAEYGAFTLTRVLPAD